MAGRQLAIPSEQAAIKSRVAILRREIDQSRQIGGRLRRRLSGQNDPTDALAKQLRDAEQQAGNLESEAQSVHQQLTALYDYWPDYPPDWDGRRRRKREYERGQCERCGRRASDVHHRTPLGRGGSNRNDNLECLCRRCHEKAHGGAEFANDAIRTVSSKFQEKQNVLRQAISDGAMVHFSYRKADGERSKRSIEPDGLKMVGRTLCVVGFCHLRQEERVFAIKRMSRLRVVIER